MAAKISGITPVPRVSEVSKYSPYGNSQQSSRLDKHGSKDSGTFHSILCATLKQKQQHN